MAWTIPARRMRWTNSEPAGSVDDADLVDVLLAWCGGAGTPQRVRVENPARVYGFD